MASSAEGWIECEKVSKSSLSNRKRVCATKKPWGRQEIVGADNHHIPPRKLDGQNAKAKKNKVGIFAIRPCQTRSKALEVSTKTGCVSVVVE